MRKKLTVIYFGAKTTLHRHYIVIVSFAIDGTYSSMPPKQGWPNEHGRAVNAMLVPKLFLWIPVAGLVWKWVETDMMIDM